MPAELPAAARVALVLGSGGARGLAHVGAIEVLEQAGFRIDCIAGSSMGALVGGIHAAGRLPAFRDWVSGLQRGDVLRLLDFAFGHPGLIKGERIIGVLKELVGEHRIEDLAIPFTAVATDIGAQREAWITRGPLFDAIRASIAIPMVFTPHRIDGRELIDGGLLSPLPIAATRNRVVDLVVAVDVNDRVPVAIRQLPRDVAALASPVPTPTVVADSLSERLAQLTEGWMDKLRPTPAVAQPGLIDLMARSLDLMQAQISRLRLALDPPDLLIRVPRDACMIHEFWRARELIEIGRAAAQRAFDAARETAGATAGERNGEPINGSRSR